MRTMAWVLVVGVLLVLLETTFVTAVTQVPLQSLTAIAAEGATGRELRLEGPGATLQLGNDFRFVHTEPDVLVASMRGQPVLSLRDLEPRDPAAVLKPHHPHALLFNSNTTVTKRLELENTLHIGSERQWKLVHWENFDVGVVRGWNNASLTSCGGSNHKMLGGYCNFGQGKIGKTFNGLPKHKYLRMTARVTFIDEWKGETITASLDNKLVWSDTFDWCPKVFAFVCSPFSVCGDENFSDRFNVLVDATIPHDSEQLRVDFESFQEQTNPCNQSWGFADVMLFIR